MLLVMSKSEGSSGGAILQICFHRSRSLIEPMRIGGCIAGKDAGNGGFRRVGPAGE